MVEVATSMEFGYLYFPLPEIDYGIGYTRDLVMTACKIGTETLVRIDRQDHSTLDTNKAHHVAQGPFKGIVINKPVKALSDVGAPDSKMQFMVKLNNAKRNGVETTENRQVRFWFKEAAASSSRSTNAKEYFKALLQPEHFPRDYVNFIKKAIVLAQHFPDVLRIELSLQPEEPPIQEQIVATAASPAFGKYVDEEIEEEEDIVEMIDNYITVLTPALYDYQYLPEVPVSNKTHVCFRVKAGCDAHIALSSVYGDTERKTYEVLIGGWENTKSAIREGGQGKIVEEQVTLKILDPEDFHTFWMSWDRGMVQVGEGRERGRDIFLRWKVPKEKQHSVNCIAVGTGPGSKGEWEFIERIRSDRKAMNPVVDMDKNVRRNRFRLSLLWWAKKQKMLSCLEDAYPNSLNTADLLRLCNVSLHDMMSAVVFLKDLQKKCLISEVSKGIWIRTPGQQHPDNAHEVKMVTEVPVLSGRENPTIAIITAQYCEKLAVDAMMDDKVSYVQYKQEGKLGESQVYTLGKLGHHQVVSTKLSRVGGGQAASIATGNVVTRLLGIFSRVDHIFIIGCGGAVPHYNDYDKHVRLGDIVVSQPMKTGQPTYIHCDDLTRLPGNVVKYDYQTTQFHNKEKTLQNAASEVKCHSGKVNRTPWARYMEEGEERLQAEESDFHRPATKKDKLYAVVNDEVVEVEHPKPPRGMHWELDQNKSRIRYGPIGSSKYIARNDRLRMDFAWKNGLVAYDAEFGAVLDAIEGSRRSSWMMIRGMSDYVDGTKNKCWQPYAALAAASYMKAVVTAMPAARRPSRW